MSYINNYGSYCGDVDRYGNPPERSKSEHPYTYSSFVIFRNGKNEDIGHSVYSDRMRGSDYKKFRKCVKAVFEDEIVGDYWPRNENIDKVQQVIRDFYDNQSLEIVLIEEMCNVSDGYPLWLLSWK